jgi:squalene synthase HpnC
MEAPLQQPPTTTAPGEAATLSAMPGEDEVLARAGGENFSVASLLLGRETRDRLMAIYGFARLVDQLGDEAAGDRLVLLDRLEADLDRVYAGSPEHPLMRRLQPAVHACGLPRGPFVRLIDANRLDQRKARYTTFDELVAYCDLSANPVGELVLHVFGAATRERIALSDRVCTGLQLVEHWQDVAEDYRRGRVYLPAEDLERFGVGEAELGAAHASDALRRLLAFEVARAREWLGVGARLVGTLHGRARLAVAGYVGGGLANAAAIEAAGWDVLPGAPRATSTLRLRETARAWRMGG